jgi:hypothetical protein
MPPCFLRLLGQSRPAAGRYGPRRTAGLRALTTPSDRRLPGRERRWCKLGRRSGTCLSGQGGPAALDRLNAVLGRGRPHLSIGPPLNPWRHRPHRDRGHPDGQARTHQATPLINQREPRAATQNNPLCTVATATETGQRCARNGGLAPVGVYWLIAGGDRLEDVADDGVGAVAAGVQVGGCRCRTTGRRSRRRVAA